MSQENKYKNKKDKKQKETKKTNLSTLQNTKTGLHIKEHLN